MGRSAVASLLLAALLALPSPAHAGRRPTAAECRAACVATIDACPDAKKRHRRCRHRVLRRCRHRGVTVCTTSPTPPAGASVLVHHRNPTRDGVYVDALVTRAAAAAMHRDPAFAPAIDGPTYAQPLFLDGGTGGRDLVFVATEKNLVYALDAATGAEVWRQALGTPVPLASLPCGNIDPLGVTGTPAIDVGSRTLFVDAMTTPDGGATKRHLVFGLSLDDGTVRAGYPVDVESKVTGFTSAVQNERGALAVVNGTLYVPFGGHFGDCGDYHGWVVGVPLADPEHVRGWSTTARAGGAWAPGGVASDGTNVYVATGNTFGATTWSGGEAIVRLAPGPAFSGEPADYFAPANWQQLDAGDVDIGGSGPILFDVPGAQPAALVVGLGKDGFAYLLDRADLGGIGGEVARAKVATGQIINAAAAYTTATGTYVVFKGAGASCPAGGGDLTAIRIGASAPPAITTAWCASQHGTGSPMVTTTDGRAEPIVWSVGAEGDGRLHGFDADTGAVVFDGGGAGDVMAGVARFSTPIAAKGRLFVAGRSTVYAFTSR